MFESIVADIIAKYIGEYIKNLSSEQLKVNIFSGNVVLRNLEIKGEALQSFKLPLHVQKGIIGTLELKIPWTNLKSMPVILEIDSICLYAIPQTGFEYNEEEEAKKALFDKQKKLDKFELIRSWKEGGGGAVQGGRQDTFMSNVMSKILNNIQVRINTFHLRYEEVRNGKVYSLGLAFGGLTAHSTDRRWSKTFADASDNETLYKYVELSDFSIYLNSDDTSIESLTGNNVDFQRTLKAMTGSSAELGDHRYILQPITVTLKVEINKNLNMDKAVPKMRVRCQFEEVSFYIEENQYQTILKLLTTIGNYAHEIKYLKYRPKARPKQDPRAWWRYFAEVYRQSIRQKIQQRSWSFIQKRRQDRKEYIILFKKLQGVEWIEPISEKETKRLQDMEEFLNSKKGEFYSSVSRTKGFFGWGWGKGAATERMTIQLTKEQQDEIYKSMEYDEIALSATIEMPPDYVQTILEVKVDAIIFTIVGSREGEDPLLKSYLSNISFKMSAREQGMRLDLDLESFNVIDHFYRDSLFPFVISSTPRYKGVTKRVHVDEIDHRAIINSKKHTRVASYDDNNSNGSKTPSPPTTTTTNSLKSSTGASAINKSDHLFNIVFETNPIDSDYDYRLSLILNALEIVINKRQIDRLVEFATPKEHVNLFGLSSVAMEELIMLKEMTIYQLREVVNHHKTIDLYVDAKAPTVIIPEHAHALDTTLIVVDLGNCVMHSDVSRTPKKKLGSGGEPLVIGGELPLLDEAELYDHYRVDLSSIRVLLARNDQEWWHPEGGGFPLVEEMAINLHIESCIEPSELSLALFRVSGTLPEVKFNISDATYLRLYSMYRTLSAETHVTGSYSHILGSIVSRAREEDTVAELSEAAMEIKLSDAYRAVLARRKLFEGEFTLQKVTIDVHAQSSRLVRLRVHELQLSVKKKTYDYLGRLLLASLDIDDCMADSDAAFSRLVTSQARKSDAAAKTLISITHHIVEKDAPDYANIDTFFDFSFGELNINYNPRSIGHVLAFLDYCFEATYALQERLGGATPAVNLPIAASPTTASVRPVAPVQYSVMRATASVYALTISLNDEGREIGMFSINEFVVQECTMNGRALDVQGYLQSVTIESFVDGDNGVPFKMLAPKSSDAAMATFKYRASGRTRPTRSVTTDDPFDSELELNLRAIHVNLLVEFILRTKTLITLPFKTAKYDALYRYQSAASEETAAAPITAPIVIDPMSMAPAKKTNFRIFLESPRLVLSSCDTLTTNDDKIVADLGSIEISTALRTSTETDLSGALVECEWQVITASLIEMNIATLRSGGERHDVLSNLSMAASIDTLLCANSTQRAIPRTRIPMQQSTSLAIKDVALSFDDMEHALILNIVSDVADKIIGDAKTKRAASLPPKSIDFAQITMTDMSIHTATDALVATSITGSVGGVRVRDRRASVQYVPLLQTVFEGPTTTSSDRPFMSFSFAPQPASSGWNSSLVLTLTPCHITACPGFILGMKDFFLLPFVKTLTPAMLDAPQATELPLLSTLDVSSMTRMKLDITLEAPTIILPISQYTPDVMTLQVTHSLTVTNKYLDWSIVDPLSPTLQPQSIGVESMIIQLKDSRIYAKRDGHSQEYTSEPFDINIDYQSVEALLNNTAEVIRSGVQPNVASVAVSRLALAVDERQYLFFCDMVSQALRSLDDSPQLCLKKKNPYLFDVMLMRDDSKSYLPEIYGMRVLMALDQIDLVVAGHSANHPPFLRVDLGRMSLDVIMATVNREKKMSVVGAIQELSVYDRRDLDNQELVFGSRDQSVTMMSFDYISLNPLANPTTIWSSQLNFSMQALKAVAYPAFLLRAWDLVVISLTGVFGSYETDKYLPFSSSTSSLSPPPSSSRMLMNVVMDAPLIVMRSARDLSADSHNVHIEPSRIAITNEFIKQSSGSDKDASYADIMKIALARTSISLLDQSSNKTSLATNYDIIIAMEMKEPGRGAIAEFGVEPLPLQHITITTNTLALTVNAQQFDALYRCLNHSLACLYELDASSQRCFLAPNHKPNPYDMLTLLSVDSIVLNLIGQSVDDTNNQPLDIAKLSFGNLSMEASILYEQSTKMTGALSQIIVTDTRASTHLLEPLNDQSYASLAFGYHTHQERTADGWDSEFECSISNAQIAPFPVSLLVEIKSLLLDPLTRMPLASRPVDHPLPKESARTKLALLFQKSRVLLYNPARGAARHLMVAVDRLDMNNTIAPVHYDTDLTYELETWTYNIEGLAVNLRTDHSDTLLLSDLEMTAHTESVRDYNHFLDQVFEYEDQISPIPPNVKTLVDMASLNLTLSREEYLFLIDLYAALSSSSSTPPSSPSTGSDKLVMTVTEEEDQRMKKIVDNMISLKIEMFSMRLTNGRYALADLSFERLDAHINLFRTSAPGAGSVIIGHLERPRMVDLRREMVLSHFKEAIDTRNESFAALVSFNLRPATPDMLPFTQQLDVTTENISITPLFDLFTDIQSYFIVVDKVDAAPPPKQDSLKYTVNMKSTDIKLPKRMEHDEHLRAEIGQMNISNSQITSADSSMHSSLLVLQITKMSLVAAVESYAGSRILEELNLDISMRNNILLNALESNALPLDTPASQVTMHVGNIVLSVSIEEYMFLYDLVNISLKRYYEFRDGPYPEVPPAAPSHVLSLTTQMHVDCNIQMLKMCMLNSSRVTSIGEFILRRLEMQVDFCEAKMTLQGLANDMVATGPLRGIASSLYNEIMYRGDLHKSMGRDLLTFTYISHSPSALVPKRDWTTELVADIRTINLVSMIGTLLKMKDFIFAPLVNPFVSPPSSAHHPADHSRMKLVFNMEPWKLLIPASEGSRDLLITSFGTTSLTNVYRNIKLPSGLTHAIEVFIVNMANLTLLTQRDDALPMPISNSPNVHLEIERLYAIPNDSSGGDQRMMVRIPTLSLVLCEADYRLLYYVFTSDWMRFGAVATDLPPIPPPMPKYHKTRRLIYEPPTHHEQARIAAGQFSSPDGFVDIPVASPPSLFVKADISILNIQISKIDPILDPIAQLSLSRLSTTFSSFTTGVSRTTMTVDAMQLVDERQNTECVFRELLTRKARTDYDVSHLVYDAFVDPGRCRAFTKVTIDHPMLFVSPNSILPILSFFSAIQEPFKYDAPAAAKPFHTRYYLQVTKPKLLLVEDETQQATRALVMKMPIEFHLSRTPDAASNMELKATKCQVFRMTPFAESEGTSSTPITNAFAFDFVYVDFTDIDQQTITLKLQPLNIFLTYKEILLINRIIQNLTQPPPSPSPSPVTTPPAVASAAGSVSTISPPMQTFSPPAIVKNALLSFKSPIRPEDSAKTMHKTRAYIDCAGRVNLTLLDESSSAVLQDVPFLQMTVGELTADYWAWSDYSFLTTSGLLKIEVFNQKHMAFDSLVEQFPINLQILQSEDPKLKVSIKAEDSVNINISHPFVAALALFKQNMEAVDSAAAAAAADLSAAHNSIPEEEEEEEQHQVDLSNSINDDLHSPRMHIPTTTTTTTTTTNATSRTRSIPQHHQQHRRTGSSSSPVSSYSSSFASSSIGGGASYGTPPSSSFVKKEMLRWKKPESGAPNIQEKPSLSASIIANTKRDSMKSSVILSHFRSHKHRRTLSSSLDSQRLFSTVGQNIFWIVNLTGKDIEYYVEELQFAPQIPANSSSSSLHSLNPPNPKKMSSNALSSLSRDQEEEEPPNKQQSSSSKSTRVLHFLKDRDKKPLELNSVLFKTRDFRTHGSLNAHIALRFTDGDKSDQPWIHGVSINMLGDNFYFPPFGNKANLIVCEVGWNESNEHKIATLRSPVIVKNASTVPIQVLVVTNEMDHTTFGPIAVDDSFYVPVDFFNYNSTLSIRPAAHGHNFDMDSRLDLADASSWPAAHTFVSVRESIGPSDPGLGSSTSLASFAATTELFHLATLVQSGIRCERTGLVCTTLVVTPPLIIENALFCDMDLRLHSHADLKRNNKNDYARVVATTAPIPVRSGGQIPCYAHPENDVGITLTLRGVGRDQYFHLQTATSELNYVASADETGSASSYVLSLKVDHRHEGGCHIVTIYAVNAITNHTMIPFVLRPIPIPKGGSALALSTNEAPMMLAQDRFLLSHPSFPEVFSREFDIVLGKEDIVEIQADSPHDTMRFQFKLLVSTGTGVFFRTRRVDVYPRFVFVNKMPLSLTYTQLQRDIVIMTRDSLELCPDDQIPFHWFNGKEEQLISITIHHNAEWTWSGGLRIDSVGTNYLKLQNRQDEEIEQIIKVEIIDTNESTMVLFYPTDPQSLPFHIKNDSSLTITFAQKHPGSKKYSLLAGEDIYYTWDHPCGLQLLTVQIESTSTEINLNKIKSFKPIKVGGNVVFPVSQAVNGITRELTFSHEFEEAKVLDMIDFAFEISFEKLGFSIINDVPEELIYIQLTDCSYWYSTSNITHTTWLIIRDIQIDNQQQETEHRVLLWCDKKFDRKYLPFLEFSAIKLNKKNFDYYDLIALYLNELYVQLDDVTLINLHSFYSKLPLDKLSSPPNPESSLLPSMFYIKWLIIAEIKIYLTFGISRDGILSNYNSITWQVIGSIGKCTFDN
eukprot:gene12285-14399_t